MRQGIGFGGQLQLCAGFGNVFVSDIHVITPSGHRSTVGAVAAQASSVSGAHERISMGSDSIEST